MDTVTILASIIVFLALVCGVQFYFLSRFVKRVSNVAKAVVQLRRDLGHPGDLGESLVSPQYVWDMYDGPKDIGKNDNVIHPLGSGVVTEIFADGFIEITFKHSVKKFASVFVWDKLVVTKRATKKVRTRNPKFLLSQNKDR